MMDQTRITIMLNRKIQLKLRDVQAKKLKRTNQSVSFSSVINEILAGVLKVKID